MSPFNLGEDADTIGAGIHLVEIVKTSAATSQAGNPVMRVVYRDAQGRELMDSYAVLPTTRWKWKQLWSACGLDFPASGAVDETELIGKRVNIEVEDGNNGRAQAKEVFAPAAGEASKFQAAAARDDSDSPF